MSTTWKSEAGAIFLVAGTCIGGGMLGMPVATGQLGFFPTVFMTALCWVTCTIIGLLLVEVTIRMEPGVHVMTMGSRLLGNWSKGISLALFVFVSYASITAYTSAAGGQLSDLWMYLFGTPLNLTIAYWAFLLVFGSIIFMRAAFVEGVNSSLFFAKLGAYLLLLFIGSDDISMENLQHKNWSTAMQGLPILLTGFSFQAYLIPTVAGYLEYQRKPLYRVVIIGTVITIVFYLVWQWIVMGTVPVDGEWGLDAAYAKGEPATAYFSNAVHSPVVKLIAEVFAFFAVATSFIGLSLGLADFLSDSLRIKKNTGGIVSLSVLILVPTYFFASTLERVFANAMETSGGIGDAIINGIFPVMMIWALRKQIKEEGQHSFIMSWPVLAFLFIFYSVVLVDEIMRLAGVSCLSS